MTAVLVFIIVAGGLSDFTRPALSQASSIGKPPNPALIFDLPLGAEAADVPVDGLMQFACGTHGGPPSRPLEDWTEYDRCRPELETGLHEVTFLFDDEAEFRARALDLPNRIAVLEGTTIYGQPIIPSALFSADGKLVGVRIVTDPKASVDTRSKALSLRNFLMARYGETHWSCENLPPSDGEEPFLSIYVKQECIKVDIGANTRLTISARHFRKQGQSAIDPHTQLPTEGQFESSVWFEETMIDRDRPVAQTATPQPDPAHHPERAPRGVREQAFLSGDTSECNGCDLRGAGLKRRDLVGVNLSGANLAGANLHDADLSNADLTGANLTEADLNKARLTRARLHGAVLARAMLYAAKLDGADLSGADLREAMLGEARATRANLAEADLSGADLRRARLLEANLSQSNLSRTWMDGAQLLRAELSASDMSGAVLNGASLKGAKALGVRAPGADLLQADLTEADLSGADLTGARLLYAVQARTNLRGAILAGTIMPDGQVHP